MQMPTLKTSNNRSRMRRRRLRLLESSWRVSKRRVRMQRKKLSKLLKTNMPRNFRRSKTL